jgi:hypothetical protein
MHRQLTFSPILILSEKCQRLVHAGVATYAAAEHARRIATAGTAVVAVRSLAYTGLCSFYFWPGGDCERPDAGAACGGAGGFVAGGGC